MQKAVHEGNGREFSPRSQRCSCRSFFPRDFHAVVTSSSMHEQPADRPVSKPPQLVFSSLTLHFVFLFFAFFILIPVFIFPGWQREAAYSQGPFELPFVCNGESRRDDGPDRRQGGRRRRRVGGEGGGGGGRCRSKERRGNKGRRLVRNEQEQGPRGTEIAREATWPPFSSDLLITPFFPRSAGS